MGTLTLEVAESKRRIGALILQLDRLHCSPKVTNVRWSTARFAHQFDGAAHLDAVGNTVCLIEVPGRGALPALAAIAPELTRTPRAHGARKARGGSCEPSRRPTLRGRQCQYRNLAS